MTMKHNWEYKKFGSLCNIVRGGSPRPIQAYLTDSEGGLNWIKIGDVAVGSKFITSTKEKIRKEGLSKTRQVFKGDFILSNSMSFGRPYILKIDGCIHDGWLAIKNVEDHFIPDFLYYFLSSPATFSVFERLVKGGVVSNLNSDIVKGISVPVPPMEVQEQIVAELDKINEVIEDSRELLRNLDAFAQSLFYDFFGDPISNPMGWEIKTWSDCITIINGKNQKAVENPKGKYPIYGSGGIMNYADEYLCPEYCTIIGRKGNISKPIFVTTKFWNVDTAFGLCPEKELIVPLYLYFFCKNYDFERHNKAVTIPSLVKSDLLKIQIPIPPFALQEKFAERIEAIEAQKKHVEETIAEMQTLLDSRMDYWFN